MRLGLRLPQIMREGVLGQVLLLTLVSGLAFGLTIPFLALIARDRGVSLTAIGVMASSYLIAQMIFQLPMGSLSDRIGRTRPIAAGFLLEGVATAAFVFADAPWTFIALRMTQGVALALIMPSTRALIADVTPDDRRGQAFAWFIACFSGGMLLGPLVGGILAQPLSRSALFVIGGAVSFAIGLWAVAFLREPERHELHRERAQVPFRALLNRPLLGTLLLGFGTRMPEGVFSGIWSIFMDDLGASSLELGLSYATWSIAFMTLAQWGGRMADRPGRWKRLMAANLVMALLVSAYGMVELVPLVLLIGVLEGAISTITMPSLDAHLSAVADPRVQGRVQGAFATVATIGAATFAFLSTILYNVAVWLPFAVSGVLLAVITLAATPLIRHGELLARADRAAASEQPAAVAAD